MKSLMLKDFIISKKNILIAIVYLVILSITWSYSKEISGVLNMLSLATFVPICTQGSNGYDDLNKSYMMIASLPTTREKIVKSRYIQVLLYLILGVGIINLISISMKLFRFGVLDIIYINSITLTIGSVFVILYYSLYYPLYFRLGNKHVAYINQIIFIALTLSPSLILKILKKHPQINITKFIMEINDKSLIFMVVSSVIIFCISNKVSQNIYKNRELI